MGARCDLCPLNDKRPVAPTGPLNAPIAFVGEGPGKFEEIQGRAFVGDSGNKLGSMLWKHGVTRDQVYVTNALLCRPETPGIEGKRRFEMKVYAAWFRKQNMMRKKAGHPLQVDPWTCCAPRLQWELGWLEHNARAAGRPNGAVIIPLGNFAMKAVSGGVEGKVGGIMKYRGSVIQVAPQVQAQGPMSFEQKPSVNYQGGAEQVFGTIEAPEADRDKYP